MTVRLSDKWRKIAAVLRVRPGGDPDEADIFQECADQYDAAHPVVVAERVSDPVPCGGAHGELWRLEAVTQIQADWFEAMTEELHLDDADIQPGKNYRIRVLLEEVSS